MQPLTQIQKEAIRQAYNKSIQRLDQAILDWPNKLLAIQPKLREIFPDEVSYQKFVEWLPTGQDRTTRIRHAQHVLEQCRDYAVSHPEGKYLPVPKVTDSGMYTHFTWLDCEWKYKPIARLHLFYSEANCDKNVRYRYERYQPNVVQTPFIDVAPRESFSLPSEWKRHLLHAFQPMPQNLAKLEPQAPFEQQMHFSMPVSLLHSATLFSYLCVKSMPISYVHLYDSGWRSNNTVKMNLIKPRNKPSAEDVTPEQSADITIP